MSRLIYKYVRVGTYEIPQEAIRLIEDIQTLERVLDQLGTLDPLSLHTLRDEGWTAKRRLLMVVAAWHTYATDRLRRNYLGGRRIKPEPKPQTLADIWRILSENMGKNEGVKTVEKKNFR